MVRWSYKTVHFALKKDGLLGGAFLDDVEMEELLNEYGKAGWDLVSVFETRDGVMAVFKQPIGEVGHYHNLDRQERWQRTAERTTDRILAGNAVAGSRSNELRELRNVPSPDPIEEDEQDPEVAVTEPEPEYVNDSAEPELFSEDDDDAGTVAGNDDESGVGAIRIE